MAAYNLPPRPVTRAAVRAQMADGTNEIQPASQSEGAGRSRRARTSPVCSVLSACWGQALLFDTLPPPAKLVRCSAGGHKMAFSRQYGGRWPRMRPGRCCD